MMLRNKEFNQYYSGKLLDIAIKKVFNQVKIYE